MVDMQAGLRRYLKFVMQDQNLSATALANQAGVAATTITRFLNDKNHKFTLSSTTLEKIATATGTNPAAFMSDYDIAELSATVAGQDKRSRGAISIAHTIGETQPGAWLEIPFANNMKFELHNIVATGYEPKNVFYLKVKGTSCNLFAAEGEYLQCIRPEEYLIHHVFSIRAIVAVERRSRDGSLVELTARLITSAVGGGYDLVYLSDDPDFIRLDEIHIKSMDDRQAGVKVIGFVLCAVRYIGSRF